MNNNDQLYKTVKDLMQFITSEVQVNEDIDSDYVTFRIKNAKIATFIKQINSLKKLIEKEEN